MQLGKRLDAAVNRGDLRLCINNRGVRWGHIDVDQAVEAPLTATDMRDLRLAFGDVLVCEGGEIGRAAVWCDAVDEAYFLNTLHRLRSRGRYEPVVLVSYLKRLASTGELSALAGKATLAHLSKQNLMHVRIPAIPAAEQVRLAEMLGDTDLLIHSLERLLAKKRAIKQGMMQELLTGRTRLPGFSDEWAEATIASLARVLGGGTPSTKTASFWGGEIPWFTPAEITAAGTRLVSKSERSITRDGLASSGAHLLPAGTVLVTSRASIGHAAVAAVPVTTNQGFASLVPNSPASTWYLYYWIQEHKTELESRSAGSTFLEISARKVSAIPIKAPSLSEQEAIGKVLQDSDAEINALERRLASTRALKQGMMQELLTGRTRLPVKEDAA